MLADLPPRLLTNGWLDYLWTLPPAQWIPEIEGRKEAALAPHRSAGPAECEEDVELFRSQLDALAKELSDGGTDSKVNARMFLVAEKTGEIERALQSVIPVFTEHEQGITLIEVAKAAMQESAPLPKMEDRWQRWLDALPTERREQGVRVVALFDLMQRLRKTLTQVLAAQVDQVLQAQVKLALQDLKYWASVCDKTYEAEARPLFQEFGVPEGVPLPSEAA